MWEKMSIGSGDGMFRCEDGYEGAPAKWMGCSPLLRRNTLFPQRLLQETHAPLFIKVAQTFFKTESRVCKLRNKRQMKETPSRSITAFLRSQLFVVVEI